MSMANEMFNLAMKRKRELIDENIVALIEEYSMNGKTSCRVDYISDEDKERLEYEGFKLTEEKELTEIYTHKAPILSKIPTKKYLSYYTIDWSEAPSKKEEDKQSQEYFNEIIDKLDSLLNLLEGDDSKEESLEE